MSRSGTVIEFSVTAGGKTTLELFDVFGRRVATLFNGPAEAGTLHAVSIRDADLSRGFYFSRLTSNGRMRTGRLLLNR